MKTYTFKKGAKSFVFLVNINYLVCPVLLPTAAVYQFNRIILWVSTATR